jgi:lipopolysaccharide export system protein LptC
VKLSTTRLFPLGLMLALAALTFWLDRAVREEEVPTAARRHDPDYILSNFTTTTYNGAGTAESMLSAAQMVHYPDDDTTELVSPLMVQTKPDEPRLSVRANRGTLSRNGDEIFLYEDVVLTRDATPANPAARMTTEFLHVLRDRSLVRTDKPVRIVEEHRSLSGRGMEYDNESRKLVLHGDVRGRFEPEDPK